MGYVPFGPCRHRGRDSQGATDGESRKDFRVRLGMGLLPWLVSWLLVFSTIAVPEYFASARKALRVAC